MDNRLEGLKTKLCRACEKVKDITSFTKNNLFKDGYESRCKICHNRGVYIYKKDREDIIDDDLILLRLRSPTKNEYTEMWKIFKSLGYDITKPINEQFSRKWGLKPDGYNLNKNTITYFSAEECNLT